MAVETHRSGAKISKFLSKFLWHFAQQPIPNYTQINRSHARTASTNHNHQQPVKSANPIEMTSQCSVRPSLVARRQSSIVRERRITLDSIAEE